MEGPEAAAAAAALAPPARPTNFTPHLAINQLLSTTHALFWRAGTCKPTTSQTGGQLVCGLPELSWLARWFLSPS